MKKYISPELDVVIKLDVISTSSLGTETTPKEEKDPIWNLDIG